MLCCCAVLVQDPVQKLFSYGQNLWAGRPKSVKHAIKICDFFTCNYSSDVQPRIVQMFLLTVITVFSLMKHSVWSNFCWNCFLCVEVISPVFYCCSCWSFSITWNSLCFPFLPGWGVGSLYNLFINAYPKYAEMTVAEQARTGPNCSVLCWGDGIQLSLIIVQTLFKGNLGIADAVWL